MALSLELTPQRTHQLLLLVFWMLLLDGESTGTRAEDARITRLDTGRTQNETSRGQSSE